MSNYDFINQVQRTRLLRWADSVRQTLTEGGQAQAAASVAEAVKKYSGDQFRIAVIGKVKRGKSTLINALLGRKDDIVAPVDKLPASSTVSEFSWAEQERAIVYYREAGRTEDISFDRIADFATEEKNPKNVKQVAGLAIQGPFAGLGKNTILVDTPGAGSAHEHHDELLHAYIPQADAVIFLVTADMPIAADEEELLGALKEADVSKIFFAINRCDVTDEKDIQDGIAHNIKVLAKVGISVSTIHRIIAKKAMQGEAGGVDALSGEIRDYLAKNRADAMAQRLISAVKNPLDTICAAKEIEVESASRTQEEIEAQVRKFQEDKQTIEAKRGLVEPKFMLAWDKAVAKFDASLAQVKAGVEKNVLATIQTTSVFKVEEAALQLPTTLMKAFEKNLEVPGAELNQQLGSAIRELEAEYPFLELNPEGANKVALRGESYLIGSGVQSAALVGVGMTVAVAGSVIGAAAGTAAATAGGLAGATTGAVGGILTWFGFTGAGAATTAAGTGIASSLGTVATACTFLAPAGLVIAGLGLTVVPLAWRSSKLKQKGQIEDAARMQITTMISHLRTVRIPELRQVKAEILQAHQDNLALHIQALDSALANAHKMRENTAALTAAKVLIAKMKVLSAAEGLVNAG